MLSTDLHTIASSRVDKTHPNLLAPQEIPVWPRDHSTHCRLRPGFPGSSLLKWSLSSATNNLMYEEREGGDVTTSNSLHLPVQSGTLIFTALCDFLLLFYLFHWCGFAFSLSKYHREISCKQGDMTFLQDACLAICFGICRQSRQVEQMVCLPLPLEGAMQCTAWPGCVTLAQTLQVFSKECAEGITLSSRNHTVLCLCAGPSSVLFPPSQIPHSGCRSPCADKLLMPHSTMWDSCYLIRVGR